MHVIQIILFTKREEIVLAFYIKSWSCINPLQIQHDEKSVWFSRSSAAAPAHILERHPPCDSEKA